MTWKPHPRHMTQEQFSEGTTIDGDRLDRALEEMVDHWNAIPKGDSRSLWVPTRYIQGYTPQDPDADAKHHFPWLDHCNDARQIAAGSTADITNPLREKGYVAPGIEPMPDPSVARPPEGSPDNSTHWQWTDAFAFRKPVIISDINLFLHVDHPVPNTTSGRVFENDFLYDYPAPEGFLTDDDSEDVAVLLAVDSVFKPEDRSLASQALIRRGFRVNREVLWQCATGGNPRSWPIAFNDGAPPDYPGGPLYGIFINLHVNQPIPADSRVRVARVLPHYSGSPAHGYFEENPWFHQYYSVGLTVLEEVEVR